MNKRTILDECVDAAGSINAPGTGLPELPSYVAPELCIGTMSLTEIECAKISDNYQDSLAAENLNVSGAPLNIFKLLGIHEQGKLIDLTGNGEAIASSGIATNAFDAMADEWVSDEWKDINSTLNNVSGRAFIGYDFGTRKTTYGQPESGKGIPENQHITSFRITQGEAQENRALQVRIERSVGKFSVNPLKIQSTNNIGTGSFSNFIEGVNAKEGYYMLFADSPTQFTVAFKSTARTEVLGIATVDKQFNSLLGSFTIRNGSIPFQTGDALTVPVEMEWLRVDVVNLPNLPTPITVRIKQSAPSRYWRIIPTSFAGGLGENQWIVKKLELFDFQATRLDDIQDPLLMENRDRDYAKSSIQIKASYSPFDAMSELSKFGFQIADVYSFNVSYASMIHALGRPIVVGDILELPAEVQYDHNLRPVRRFLEVSDVGWAADGFTTAWKPIIYKFQAQQLIPAQEHRDLLGTIDTQKYIIDDGKFFEGVDQIQTAPKTVTEANYQDALDAVPEKGTNIREAASGTNRFQRPGSYDGVGLYVSDGLPPDGAPYKSGFKLPDVSEANDLDFFRLEYDPKLKIPARLYKFSIVKNKWMYVETDNRSIRSSSTPSQKEIFKLQNTQSPSKPIK